MAHAFDAFVAEVRKTLESWGRDRFDYCRLHSGGRWYMIRESISDLNEKLDPRQFIRIHRSSIVNLSYVKEIYSEGQSDSSVVMNDGQRLKMSKVGGKISLTLGDRGQRLREGPEEELDSGAQPAS
jgi:hypothetical protein